jgi:DsbC/DsbD-like thiol-disulfide interchange protein
MLTRPYADATEELITSMKRTLTRTLIAALLVACWTGTASAAESAPVSSTRATASLVSNTDAVAPGTAFRVGLYIRLAPGWHTYWKNPGDAGVPPDIDLTLPTGSKAGPIAWPAPRRLAEGPVMTYAYTGDVLLPITITPPPGAAGIAIQAHAQWLVCKDICVPEEGDFRLDLPDGAATASAQAPLFATFDRQMPRSSPWQAVAGADGTLWVQGVELTPATVLDAWFIPDTPGTILDGAAQPLTVWHGGFTLSLRPGKAFKPDAGLSGILAVRDRAGLETDVVVQAAPGAVPPPTPSMRLQRMLGLAFLG